MYVCRTLKHEEAAQLQKCQQPDKYIETAQHAIIAPEAGGTGAHVVATMMHRTRHVFTCTSRLVGVELARSPLSSNLAATPPPLPPPPEAPPKEAAVAPGPLPLSRARAPRPDLVANPLSLIVFSNRKNNDSGVCPVLKRFHNHLNQVLSVRMYVCKHA